MARKEQENQQVEIIEFERAHADRFRDLNYEWLQEYFEIEPYDEIVLSNPEKQVLAHGGFILMARAGSEIVGTCALLRHTENRYELAKMAVTRDYRGHGIGRRLVEAAIEKVRGMGVESLVLATSKLLGPANRLYESVGFQYVSMNEIGPIPYKRHTVAMELQLPKPQ